MSEARIAIKIGEIEFSGEGEQGWVAEQLDKVMAKAHDLVVLAPSTARPPAPKPDDGKHQPMSGDGEIAAKPLPKFLAEKQATKNQVQKFLATSVWLEAKGKNRLSTGDVSKALKESNQTKLGNPSECLNKNVGKGFCEKDGKQFFVKQEGKDSLSSC